MADKLDMKSMNITQENIRKIQALFPNVVTEVMVDGKVQLAVDFDTLREELSTVIVEGKQERYQFTWPEKSKAKLLAAKQITSTLRPCVEESVNFDTTQNLYIEGDNLDVLKLLQETYLGKVKMIYIDPPYNTGNDFVYEDDFAQTADEFSAISGDYDDMGNRMIKNVKSNGRFHTDWLNMMYPRLKLAKDLLTIDGVIFISIDDNEINNLRKICDEVFGVSNYINTFCWVNNLKGRQISNTGAVKTYEYILCYAKSYEHVVLFQGNIGQLKNIMPSSYKGFRYDTLQDEKGEYVIKNELYNTNSIFNEVTRPNLVFCIHYNAELRMVKFSKPNDNIEYPGYVKIMPKTNNDGVHKYQAWRWSQNKILEELQDLEFVRYGDTYKIYTKIRNFDVTNIKDIITDIGNGNGEMEKCFGTSAYFSYPKSTILIALLQNCLSDKNIIVLDFFSGSATTAHAVMQLNAEDGGKRRFIMVQLPEKCDERSEAFKAGYTNICEIGKERIRRAGKSIVDENPLLAQNLDIGFRVLKLDSSNMQDVYYNPARMPQSLLDMTVDNIKPDRTALDLLFQVMLSLGIELSAKIEEKQIAGKTFYVINENEVVVCFDEDINNDVITTIAKMQPIYAVFKDKSFANDSVGINNEQLFKTYSPSTIVKVI